MMSSKDPFDLDNLRLSPEAARKHWATVPKKIQKQRQQFVKVPWAWIERLEKTRSANIYRVALHLLFRHWRGNGQPILLANGMLEIEGVTRFAKWRALERLEQLGMITIERRRRKSPLVTVLM